MHHEEMHPWEDALFEMRWKSNQMVCCRTQEPLLRICIQFAQDNGQDLLIQEYDSILRILEHMFD